jgi:hypothetical protein
MGNLFFCCKKEPEDTSGVFAKGESEINFPIYTSSSDEYFTLVEKDFNLIVYIQLLEYMNLLEAFSIETATVPFEGKYRHDFSSKDPFLDNIIHQGEFQSFIENKLFNINEIVELYGEDIQTLALFKDCFLKIYSALNLRLNSFLGNTNKNEEIITKLNLVAIGILFCRGKNISKIKLFFDLFKNENGVFIKSEKLNNYLISSFFIASYCLVSVRAFIDNEEKGLPKISNNLTQTLLDKKGLSQKNCEILLKYFNDKFFGEKEGLNWDEFKQKFSSDNKQENESFGWIFSTSGIRSKLEDKNI